MWGCSQSPGFAVYRLFFMSIHVFMLALNFKFSLSRSVFTSGRVWKDFDDSNEITRDLLRDVLKISILDDQNGLFELLRVF